MAEPFGTIAGALSVAALFNNCVQCFEYIQSGRKFGHDFERYLLRVDSARLRLEKWGKGAGINQDPRFKQETTADETSLHVCKVLGQVMFLFKKLQEASKRFEVGRDRHIPTGGTSRSLGAEEAYTLAEESIRQRQKRSSIGMKTRWALYEKKNFDRLSQDLTGFLDDLERIIPPETSGSVSTSPTMVDMKDDLRSGTASATPNSSPPTSPSNGFFPQEEIICHNKAENIKCRGRAALHVGSRWSTEAIKGVLATNTHKTLNTVTCIEVQGDAALQVGSNYGY